MGYGAVAARQLPMMGSSLAYGMRGISRSAICAVSRLYPTIVMLRYQSNGPQINTWVNPQAAPKVCRHHKF
jgi:hypothetical protein